MKFILFMAFLGTSMALFGKEVKNLMPGRHSEERIIINAPNIHDTLPNHFRTSVDGYRSITYNPPTRQGLDKLSISGSAQFSEEGFITMLEALGKPTNFAVIDLRQECHGFVNGIAVSWHKYRNWSNIGKTNEDIQKNERARLDELFWAPLLHAHHILKKDDDGNVVDTKFEIIPIHSVESEANIVEKQWGKYHRVNVTDHMRPSDEEVDNFMRFITKLPNDTWIHFHCSGGDGRTTLFMAMYDMIKNAKHVSFEDIIRRQHLLGGVNLMEVSPGWKKEVQSARRHFIKKFYDYAKMNQDRFSTSWSEFARNS